MTPLQVVLYELETLKEDKETDPRTLESCIKITERLLDKEKWDLDRAYDTGWVDCLKSNKI